MSRQTTVTIFCDKCHLEILAKEEHFLLSAKLNTRARTDQFDICQGCWNDFLGEKEVKT